MCLLLVLTAVSAEAKKKQGGYQKAYVFGFASSFTDSVAYLTDVQELDSAYIMPNGFIADRHLYSLQMYGYVNEKLGVKTPTVAFFFALNRKKIDKKFQKVKSMYLGSSNVKLEMVNREDFHFTSEEYMETLITESEEGVEAKADAKKSKKDKPKKGDRPEMPGGMPPGGTPPGGMNGGFPGGMTR